MRNSLFSVLRTDEWDADLDAGGQAALHAGTPNAATRRPPNPITQQPVGRRARAAPLAVALVLGPTPSRSAARRSAGVWTDAFALRRLPKRTCGAERCSLREPTIGRCADIICSTVQAACVPGVRLETLALRRSPKQTQGAKRGR